MRVSDLILDVLSQYGVRHVFGVPGDAINDLTFALKNRDDMDFVLVRHEEAGAFAASATAKLTGTLGCCMGTAGGGAIHLLNGLYDAKMDGAPVLTITGQVASRYIGTGYHQEVDLERLFSDVAVYSKTVMTEDQLPHVLLEACKAAMAHGGVAHINVPTDVAGRTIKPTRTDYAIGLAAGETRPCDPSLRRAADLINGADKVALLVGIGAAAAREEVLALSDLVKAPIVRTLRAKDWIDEDVDACVGGLGLLGGKPGSEAMETCDLLVMIGTDYPYEEFYPKSARTIQIEPVHQRMGKRQAIDAPLKGHARPTLQALIPLLSAKSDSSFLTRIVKAKADQHKAWQGAETSEASPIRPQRLMASIDRLAPMDAIFLCDTGTSTAWTARHLIIREQRRYTLSSSLGTMAFAMPGALGAQLAFPERTVVAIAGDGGFAMLMADFVTAVKYDLPIVCVVLDNSKLGFIALEQEGKGLPEHSIDLLNPDFKAFAEACGGMGYFADTPETLEEALGEAFSSRKPSVVHVAVTPDELIMPPHITFDQAYHFGLAKVRELLDTD